MATPSACIASLAEVQLACSSAAVSLSPGTVLGTSVQQQQLHFYIVQSHFPAILLHTFAAPLDAFWLYLNLIFVSLISRTLVIIVGWHSDAFISLFGNPNKRKRKLCKWEGLCLVNSATIKCSMNDYKKQHRAEQHCHQDGAADGCLEVLCSLLLVFLCLYCLFFATIPTSLSDSPL